MEQIDFLAIRTLFVVGNQRTIGKMSFVKQH